MSRMTELVRALFGIKTDKCPSCGSVNISRHSELVGQECDGMHVTHTLVRRTVVECHDCQSKKETVSPL